MIAKIITNDKREYVSYVFALLNKNFDTAIITYDETLGKFEFINMYKSSPSLTREAFIIDSDEDGFTYKDELILDFDYDDIGNTLSPISAYNWILNKEILSNIIEGNDIDIKYQNIAKKLNGTIELPEWQIVKDEKEIKNLLILAWGFHDSAIYEVKYIRNLDYYDPTVIKVTFRQCWGCEINLLFEDDALMHFPAKNSNNIFGASILFDKGYIYWISENVSDISQIKDDYIYFRARSLKWRFNIR